MPAENGPGSPRGERQGEVTKNTAGDAFVSHAHRRAAPVLNTALAGRASRAVLSLAASRCRWREESRDNDRGTVHWVVAPDDLAMRLERRKKSTRLAKLPGMYELCKKAPTARLMRAMQGHHPERFGFWPRTWIFPDDLACPPDASAGVFRTGPLILKPDDGAQGDGIYLLCSGADLNRRLHQGQIKGGPGASCVIQRYLGDPMLFDGFKFDLRLYVLIVNVGSAKGPSVFLSNEGLVRVCSARYSAPDKSNAHKYGAHLTNYSINKLETRCGIWTS
jgi:tubulin polyglutamylase TTLL6/13